LLDGAGLVSDEVAAVDSLLLLPGPFRVMNLADWVNLGSDRNTRVIIFVLNLPASPSPSVIVNLVDSNNQSYDLSAEDVRPVSGTNLTQIVFRLPSNLRSASVPPESERWATRQMLA
jgi:hypothetical protein